MKWHSSLFGYVQKHSHWLADQSSYGLHISNVNMNRFVWSTCYMLLLFFLTIEFREILQGHIPDIKLSVYFFKPDVSVEAKAHPPVEIAVVILISHYSLRGGVRVREELQWNNKNSDLDHIKERCKGCAMPRAIKWVKSRIVRISRMKEKPSSQQSFATRETF